MLAVFALAIYIAAWIYLINTTVRTVLAHHANSPVAQGLQHGF